MPAYLDNVVDGPCDLLCPHTHVFDDGVVEGFEFLADVCQGLLEVLHEVVPYPIQRIAGLLLEPRKLKHKIAEVLHGLLEVPADFHL